MKKILGLTVIFALFATVISCTTFKVDGLSYGGSGEILGTFEKKVTVNKFLGQSGGSTLFNFSQDSTDEKIMSVISSECARLGGSRAINISIEQKATFGQIFANSLTGRLWAPVKLIIKGTVVKD